MGVAMKLITPIAALCAFGLISSDASACDCFGTRACHVLLDECNQLRGWDTSRIYDSQWGLYRNIGEHQAKCKMLYDAAIKEKGVWGSAEARAASKTNGISVFCIPD